MTESSPRRCAAIAAPTACKVWVPTGTEIGAQHFSVKPNPPFQVPRQAAATWAAGMPRTRNTPSSRYCGNNQSVLRRQAAAPIWAASWPRQEANSASSPWRCRLISSVSSSRVTTIIS
ncbi:hypothetical protein C1Y40_02068 [Mycobacterium talmoniae]|uniref:Uncharacterized protein n=1 Tax=Mycobacterium talmoniae TaxID=1858794 RepID=A0A2S8BLZ8_9MYCO|nr:hypothetical protein C1Y40_02068 [Mycobacterium talmoniae]